MNPLVGIKGSKMDINILRYLIEEIYSLKFLKDTQALAKKEDSEPESFPVFVGKFLINKYPKKSNLDQQTINILTSIDYYSRTLKDVKLFSKFLSEEYDADDLIFYLFVRSCIEKELKFFFLEKAKENVRNSNNAYNDLISNEVYVPVKSCKKIGVSIFGNDEVELLNAFLEKINQLATTESLNNKKTMVKATSIMSFSVEDYHQSRGDTSGQVSSFVNEDELIDMQNGDNLRDKNQNIIMNGQRSNEFKNILIKAKADKCQNETEKKNAIKKILNDYSKEKEIDNYFKKLLNSNPIFDSVTDKMAKSIENVKEMTLKKISVIINLIFSQEKKTFLSFLKLKDSDSKGTKQFTTLIETLEKMLKTEKLSELDEGIVIFFIRTIFDIPEFNIQISKLLLKNIE